MTPHNVRRRARGALLLVVSLWSSACFAYRNVGRLPDEGPLPRDVRIYRYDGSVVKFAHSTIAADTIRGFQAGSARPVVVPLAHVDSMHYTQFEPRKSTIAAALTVAAFVGVIALVRNSELRGRPPTLPPGF